MYLLACPSGLDPSARVSADPPLDSARSGRQTPPADIRTDVRKFSYGARGIRRDLNQRVAEGYCGYPRGHPRMYLRTIQPTQASDVI